MGTTTEAVCTFSWLIRAHHCSAAAGCESCMREGAGQARGGQKAAAAAAGG